MPSALVTLDGLREHLLADAAIASVIKDRAFFAQAPLGAGSPHLLYRVRNARHEHAFGSADAAVIDMMVDINLVQEDANPSVSLLVTLVGAVHDAMLTWSPPTGMAITNIERITERADAFIESGRFYQTFTVAYRVQVTS